MHHPLARSLIHQNHTILTPLSWVTTLPPPIVRALFVIFHSLENVQIAVGNDLTTVLLNIPSMDWIKHKPFTTVSKVFNVYENFQLIKQVCIEYVARNSNSAQFCDTL